MVTPIPELGQERACDHALSSGDERAVYGDKAYQQSAPETSHGLLTASSASAKCEYHPRLAIQHGLDAPTRPISLELSFRMGLSRWQPISESGWDQ